MISTNWRATVKNKHEHVISAVQSK